MKKRFSLNSVISTSILFGSLVFGFNLARAQPIHSPVPSLEDSLNKIWEKPPVNNSAIIPDDSWDRYCDSVIRDYMNVPLYLSYKESIPLLDRTDTVAYFMIYSGFRDSTEQNLDVFTGFVGTGESSRGYLKRLSQGVTRVIVIYNEGVYPEQEEEWCKEQTCFGQDMRNDSLYKSNLLGTYQTKLIKLGTDIEKKLFSSTTGLLHIAKSLIDLPLDIVNFATRGNFPGELETEYGSQYKEPITAEEIWIYPMLGFMKTYGIKARDTRVAWKSTRRRRPLKIYIETKLQRTWIHEGLLKYADFGLGKPIVRTLDVPQRSETE